MKKLFLTLLGVTIIGLLFIPTCNQLKPIRPIEDSLKTINSKYVNKICFKMYESMEKYSEEYKIPKHIFYNLAFLETRYRGPYDLQYKHDLVSRCGALGPMQIMPSSAKFMYGNTISKTKLKNDFDFNIELSAKILTYLHNKYKNWYLVCGVYNTGRPIINEYARFCVNTLNYKDKWKSPYQY